MYAAIRGGSKLAEVIRSWLATLPVPYPHKARDTGSLRESTGVPLTLSPLRFSGIVLKPTTLRIAFPLCREVVRRATGGRLPRRLAAYG